MGAVAIIARISRRAPRWGAVSAAASVLMGAQEGGDGQRYVLERAGLSVTIETAVRRELPRFDETAAVSAVSWNGRDWLTGAGLVDEFGLEGFGVLGFSAAAVGGEFVKIGVGVLTRDASGPYRFLHSYPRQSSFPVQVAADENGVTVTQHSEDVNGYRYDYVKSFTIDDERRLVIAYELTNLGGRAFRFEHYNHNFFGLKAAGGAKDCRLETAFRLQTPPEGWAVVSDGTAQWIGEDRPVRGQFWRMPFDSPAEPHALTLSFKDGYAVQMTGSSPVTRLAVWLDETAVCPELFSRFSLEPGETARWTRTYRFAELNERSAAR